MTITDDHSHHSDPEPKVGMGATICLYSDRHAVTIVAVSANLRTVKVQRDHAKRTDNSGMSDSQSYDYSPDTTGAVETFTLRKNGCYVGRGSAMRHTPRLRIGHRREYYDFSF